MRNLSNSIVLITGGTGVLGMAFAEKFLSYGARVVLCDINEDTGREAVLRLSKLSSDFAPRLQFVMMDVTSVASIELALDAIQSHFGVPNVLVNNAATKSKSLERMFDRFEDYQLETWREIMAVNVDGAFLVAQAFSKRRNGITSPANIIQISSIYGVMGPDQRIYEGSRYLDREINTPAIYSTTKAALIGLTNYLATYLAPRGIRVNAVAPGGVESGQNDVFKEKYSARIPLNRMAISSEIAGAVCFLASEEASYITGQTLMVDGGLSAW
jgi:NAD(P)-dependent dehydrogenase (short-subunit alcohol dehydrogenase family)